MDKHGQTVVRQNGQPSRRTRMLPQSHVFVCVWRRPHGQTGMERQVVWGGGGEGEVGGEADTETERQR